MQLSGVKDNVSYNEDRIHNRYTPDTNQGELNTDKQASRSLKDKNPRTSKRVVRRNKRKSRNCSEKVKNKIIVQVFESLTVVDTSPELSNLRLVQSLDNLFQLP